MNNLKLLISSLIIFLFASSCEQKNEEFTWPNGAKAAISLTYDDGLASHVNTVGPMLEKYNFKATFYPTASSPSLKDDLDKWKKLATNGHELGNHTVYHPCQKSKPGMEWVKDEYDLDKYTSAEIAEEIKLGNTILSEIDGSQSRTFAYPCSHHFAGGESYVGFVSTQFPSARNSSGAQEELLKPADIDLFNVQSWGPNKHRGDDLIAYIQKVIDQETFSTITFHGVGAEHLPVSKEAHEKMLQFLDSNRDKIWVDTFEANTEYLKSHRNKVAK